MSCDRVTLDLCERLHQHWLSVISLPVGLKYALDLNHVPHKNDYPIAVYIAQLNINQRATMTPSHYFESFYIFCLIVKYSHQDILMRGQFGQLWLFSPSPPNGPVVRLEMRKIRGVFVVIRERRAVLMYVLPLSPLAPPAPPATSCDRKFCRVTIFDKCFCCGEEQMVHGTSENRGWKRSAAAGLPLTDITVSFYFYFYLFSIYFYFF